MRGLAFRGDDEIIGSQHNGNFLGSLELISQFDPFLLEHLKNYGNPGKGQVSYLSSTICDELIAIMGEQVLSKIIGELKSAKYYSISVDSTPDVSHIDQLTFIVRYVFQKQPIERFLKFIPIFGHKSEYLAEVVIEFLEYYQIPFEDCRGQTYDNATNMSGQYSGLQARIRQKCEFAPFVPCAGHSLNLVGTHAVECVTEATSFFQFVQKLYAFFVVSTHRWKILTDSLGPHKVLKRLSETRWFAHADAVDALRYGYKGVERALDIIANDKDEQPDTKHEAKNLLKSMRTLEKVILTEVWGDILSKIRSTSAKLQNSTIALDVACQLLDSTCNVISNMREEFDEYESAAKKKLPNVDYKDLSKRKRERSSRLTFFDGNAPAVDLCGKEKFKVDTFLPIIDRFIAEFTDCSKKYSELND